MKKRMNKKPTKKVYLPSWLFISVMILVYEAFLFFGTTDEVLLQRFAVIMAFALGLGTVISFLVSLLPAKAQKWTTLVVVSILAVLYIVQYFIFDAYQVFMTFEGIINGAGGVATNYLDVVVSLVTRNLWKIILLLLPIFLYGKFVEIPKTRWITRICLFCVALSMYMLACGMVFMFQVDASRFTLDTSFDSSVQSFGLNVGLGMNLFQGNEEDELEFGEEFYVPVTEAPTEAPVQTEPENPSEAEEVTEAPTEPPRVYQPHSLGLDFAAMAEAEKKENIKKIHTYLSTISPAMENEYTGLFEGKNLILITAEAFSSYVVDEQRTPTLYRMMTEGIYFTDYYQPVWGAGTTGGEYSNLLSMIPFGSTKSMEEVVQQNIFHTMGKQLQAKGYASAAFHNNDYTYYNRHKTHTYLGYDIFIGEGNGMEEGITHMWPQSDEEMFQFTIPQYLDQQPFSLYYMTVSGHATYFPTSNAMARKNWSYVENMECSDVVKSYLACNMEVEHSMKFLLDQLEEKGIADDTVVVIATDHYPYGLAPSDTWGTKKNYLAELMGGAYKTSIQRDKSALIIWSGCLEDMDLQVDDPVMSLDILPTLSNLFGLEYDSRLMCGRDVFSDQMPIALWVDGSWKTTKGVYDGKTTKFYPEEGVEVDQEYIKGINTLVRNKWNLSKAVTYNNYFDYINAELEKMGVTVPGATKE